MVLGRFFATHTFVHFWPPRRRRARMGRTSSTPQRVFDCGLRRQPLRGSSPLAPGALQRPAHCENARRPPRLAGSPAADRPLPALEGAGDLPLSTGQLVTARFIRGEASLQIRATVNTGCSQAFRSQWRSRTAPTGFASAGSRRSTTLNAAAEKTSALRRCRDDHKFVIVISIRVIKIPKCHLTYWTEPSSPKASAPDAPASAVGMRPGFRVSPTQILAPSSWVRGQSRGHGTTALVTRAEASRRAASPLENAGRQVGISPRSQPVSCLSWNCLLPWFPDSGTGKVLRSGSAVFVAASRSPLLSLPHPDVRWSTVRPEPFPRCRAARRCG